VSDLSNLVAALITGGLGAAVGGIGTAVVQASSHKNESRATAADLVSNAAGNLADRLDKLNTRLETENRQMRKAMVSLTEAIEEMLPAVTDDSTRRRVQKAINNARVAFS
jgi:uncharacterized protein HemX